MAAFFTSIGDGRFLASEHTGGPWTVTNQHLGPPSALLARALERLPSEIDGAIARVTVEILGPVPVGEVQVTAEVERGGRSVELLKSTLLAGGREVAVCRAWRIAASDSSTVTTADAEPLPSPESGTPMGRPEGWAPGYLDVMEWRSLKGALGVPGPATIWARQQIPLVDDEPPTGLQRLLVLADSGNGVSGLLDPREWLFINTELTVHVQRTPVGEWIALDAHSVIGPDGVGAAYSVLHDQQGPLARGAQALLVRKR